MLEFIGIYKSRLSIFFRTFVAVLVTRRDARVTDWAGLEIR